MSGGLADKMAHFRMAWLEIDFNSVLADHFRGGRANRRDYRLIQPRYDLLLKVQASRKLD